MSYVSRNELSLVAQHCGQFTPSGTITASMSTGNNVSCNMCKNWTGTKCMVNAFDAIAKNLDIN